MKIKRKQYEKALKVVEHAWEQLKIVKAWEDATKKVGDLGNQQIIAITVNDDGTIRTECEVVHGRGDRQPTEGKPQ